MCFQDIQFDIFFIGIMGFLLVLYVLYEEKYSEVLKKLNRKKKKKFR